MRLLRRNDQTGRSMVEMLGVLAIIGVLSVGGIAGYSKAMAKFKISKTLDQISMLITNIRTFYGNQATFANLNNANAIEYDLVSADMYTTSPNIFNPFGGAVTIATANNNTQFTIQYAGLDKPSCMSIAMADWGSSASSGLVSVTVNATAYTWIAGTLPIGAAAAAANCQSNALNSITWTYN